MKTIDDVPMILRRQIEASIAAPFLRRFEEELGKEKTREITKDVISKLARQSGESLGKAIGFKSLLDIKEKVNPLFNKGEMLDFDYKESSQEKLAFNVTRCAYVKMYKELGLHEYGPQLSCQRDEFLFKGIDPDIKFTRTQTLMQGGTCCDFCLELAKKNTNEN